MKGGALALALGLSVLFVLMLMLTWELARVDDKPPLRTASPAPAVHYTFAGQDSQATELFRLREGLTTFRLDFGGQYAFVVWLLDATGLKHTLLIAESGGGKRSKATYVPAGDYLLAVTTSDGGPWSIVVEQ